MTASQPTLRTLLLVGNAILLVAFVAQVRSLLVDGPEELDGSLPDVARADRRPAAPDRWQHLADAITDRLDARPPVTPPVVRAAPVTPPDIERSPDHGWTVTAVAINKKVRCAFVARFAPEGNQRARKRGGKRPAKRAMERATMFEGNRFSRDRSLLVERVEIDPPSVVYRDLTTDRVYRIERAAPPSPVLGRNAR